MASRQVNEDCDESSSIKRSYSQELGSTGWLSSSGLKYGLPKRYVLACMAFLGFANVYALRVNLSVAIVAMTRNVTVVYNGTESVFNDFDWSPGLQGLVLSSFFWGYIVTQLPGGYLSRRFGGKYLFGGGVLGTAALTIITPPIARLSVYLLMALRILEGLFEGVTYPCIHALWSKWAPPLERSRLATIAFSGSYFGTVIALPLSGIIADTIGWTWIFYVFGVCGIIWFLCWCWLVTESPETHSTISQQELEHIQQSIGFTDQQTKGQSTPWKEIFTSLPVWAIILAHFAENWGFYTMLTELPTYLDDRMHYDLHKAGFVAAIPYLVMVVMIQVGGQLADLLRRRQILSTTNTRKAFNCFGFVCQTIFMLAVAYTVTPASAIACLTLAVGFGGFAWAGFSVNHLDVAPQFASILMGVSNTFATIPGIVSPTITGHIVADGTADQWRTIFYLAAGIYCAGAVFYGLFASGKQQQWAEVPLGYMPQMGQRTGRSLGEEEEEEGGQ